MPSLTPENLNSIDRITFSKGSPPTVSMSIGNSDVYFDRATQDRIIKILEAGMGGRFKLVWVEHDCCVWQRVAEEK